MQKLILHPTETSLWHALVNEAQATSAIVLPEITESYLVFLLMRFTQGTHLSETVVAYDLLEAMQAISRRQIKALKEVGDKSLLLCGLFPGLAERRRVSAQYYAEVGQAAFLTLSELAEVEHAGLYAALCEQFDDLRAILQALRLR